MFGGINAIIVGNYLTNLGRPASQDLEMLNELKMPIKALGQTLRADSASIVDTKNPAPGTRRAPVREPYSSRPGSVRSARAAWWFR